MSAVKVEILGREYVLRSKMGEEQVRRVAEHLNSRIQESLSAAQSSQLAAVVLAALNITNELLQVKDQQEDLLQEIEAKSERLLGRIEQRS